jgi:hypothetical protein
MLAARCWMQEVDQSASASIIRHPESVPISANAVMLWDAAI